MDGALTISFSLVIRRPLAGHMSSAFVNDN